MEIIMYNLQKYELSVILWAITSSLLIGYESSAAVGGCHVFLFAFVC